MKDFRETKSTFYLVEVKTPTHEIIVIQGLKFHDFVQNQMQRNQNQVVRLGDQSQDWQ